MMPLPQLIDASAPGDPEYSCSIAPEVFRVVPMLFKVIVAKLCTAVNRNHTSSSGLPVAQPTEAVGSAEAPNKCASLVIPGVNVVACAAASLLVRQMLKFQLPGLDVGVVVVDIRK
jgi:hypothetical protein